MVGQGCFLAKADMENCCSKIKLPQMAVCLVRVRCGFFVWTLKNSIVLRKSYSSSKYYYIFLGFLNPSSFFLSFFLRRSSRMRSARQDSFVSADESSSDDGSSDEEPYVDLKTLRAQSELPNDFWQVIIEYTDYD